MLSVLGFTMIGLALLLLLVGVFWMSRVDQGGGLMDTSLLVGLACVAVAVLLVGLALADLGGISEVRRSLGDRGLPRSRPRALRAAGAQPPFADRVAWTTPSRFVGPAAV